MKQCTCSDHTNNTAVVTTAFMGTPEPWQLEFIKSYAGKLVCFDCGGVVPEQYRDNADHVTATTTSTRLRQLGVI
jgi:hypothetical protein